MRSLSWIVCLLIWFPFASYADDSRQHANQDFADSTWVISFGGAYTSRVLNHQETSANSNYSAIGELSYIQDIRLSFSVMKEFVSQNKISFTVTALGGLSDGGFDSEDSNLSTFNEKFDSVHFGAGLSVNYNLYAYGIKIQPYIGANIIQEQGEYVLSHANGIYALKTTHSFDDQIALLSLGLRAFDVEVGLMSYFQLSMPQVLGESLEASGQVDSTEISIATPVEIKRDPLVLSLGFGYYF